MQHADKMPLIFTVSYKENRYEIDISSKNLIHSSFVVFKFNVPLYKISCTPAVWSKLHCARFCMILFEGLEAGRSVQSALPLTID